LAVLAFVGRDEGRLEGLYGDAIKKGIRYIVRQQDTQGRFGSRFGGAMYNHGIATVALLELYGLTSDEQLKGPIDRAISYIRDTQSSKGGWGYLDGPPDSANTSISIWQLHALLLANKMGWENTGRNVAAGLAWLRTMVDKGGYVGYRGPRDFPYGSETLTAMGAFCLFTSASESTTMERSDMRIRYSLKNIASRQGRDIDYYRWYFLTYALHTGDGLQSEQWIANLRETLLESQIKSGPHAGSWEPTDRWSSAGGRVYATAMAALCLEVRARAPKITGWTRGTH
jgi:hypothetical protein